MRKIITLLTIFLSINFGVKSQDLLIQNTYLFAPGFYNTAAIAGDSSNLDVHIVGRATDLVENRGKFNFMINGNFAKLKLGIGAKINTSFTNGFTTNTSELLLAKRMRLKDNHALDFGINFGLIYRTFNFNNANGYVNMQDPELSSNNFNKIAFTSGLGVNYAFKDLLNIGFSVPYLVETFNGINPIYVFNANYKAKFKFSDAFYMQPKFLMYANHYTIPTFQPTIKFGYQNYVWFETGMRSVNNFICGIGGGYKMFTVGYFFNGTMQNVAFKQLSNSRHNIGLQLKFLK